MWNWGLNNKKTFYKGTGKTDNKYDLLDKLIADAKHMNDASEKEIESQKIDIIIRHLESMKTK